MAETIVHHSSADTHLPPRDIPAFQEYIFSWWKKHRRDLPWRRTRDPYCILVSEIMLQQTQVSRVLSKYHEFLDAFSEIEALARAKTSHVLRVWKGMGYNRRALYLKQSANVIVSRFNGIFPHVEQDLRLLPGVGEYTARAILIFAFEKQLSCVDTNIEKIITRVFFEGVKQPPSVIKDMAEKILPEGKAWHWHQALMDYGAFELNSKKDPTIVNRKSTTKRMAFHETDRFFRGRVVDRLRDGSVKERTLIQHCMKTYGKDTKYIKKILQGLEKDGLITRSQHGIISLPD